MIVYNGETVKAWVSSESGLVTIKAAGFAHLMPEELIDITNAVEQYLEIESAAEYIDDIIPEG